MLLWVAARILNWVIDVYITILFIRMILDWVSVLAPRWYPRGVIAALIRVIYQLTEPPLRWLRRYVPPIRMGAVAFDTSFLVLYFALIFLQILV